MGIFGTFYQSYESREHLLSQREQNMRKDARWKQNNPFEQLTTMRNSIQGDFENFVDGVIDKTKFCVRFSDFEGQLSNLEYFLCCPEEWTRQWENQYD